ncbi:hypothetical protein TELCIR_03909, partial [Teladorsagia circumcincta]
LVYGFCSKEDAENLLRCVPRSVLLVRFSDIEYAKIKISVKDQNGEIRHHWYEHSDLNARVPSKELLANQRFAQIDLIYPDIDMEEYGNVITFWLGPIPTVHILDFETAKEEMIVNGAAYAVDTHRMLLM